MLKVLSETEGRGLIRLAELKECECALIEQVTGGHNWDAEGYVGAYILRNAAHYESKNAECLIISGKHTGVRLELSDDWIWVRPLKSGHRIILEVADETS